MLAAGATTGLAATGAIVPDCDPERGRRSRRTGGLIRRHGRSGAEPKDRRFDWAPAAAGAGSAAGCTGTASAAGAEAAGSGAAGCGSATACSETATDSGCAAVTVVLEPVCPVSALGSSSAAAAAASTCAITWSTDAAAFFGEAVGFGLFGACVARLVASVGGHGGRGCRVGQIDLRARSVEPRIARLGVRVAGVSTVLGSPSGFVASSSSGACEWPSMIGSVSGVSSGAPVNDS